MYANIDIENDTENTAEEHILPDNLDDINNVETQGAEKSSVSPSSRKSASSHASRGSQDSGIGILVSANQNQGGTVLANQHSSSMGTDQSRKPNNKAWYDVPSDDETEAPEADSLASIISHRGSSDDEN